MTFVDLEKVWDRVPRQEVWKCMSVSEKCVRVVKDTYERERTH